MINPWFKFYGSEYLSDPKIANLTAQERSCWITLLCLASASSTPGKIEHLTPDILLSKSGIEFDPMDTTEWEAHQNIFNRFESLGMISVRNGPPLRGVTNSNAGVVTVCNWNKRQNQSLTNAERQAKYRLKKKLLDQSNEKVTGVTTKVTLEKNRIEKNRIDNNNTSEQSSQIVQLIDLFHQLELNASAKRWYGNKTQRGSLNRLIKEFGFENVKKVIELLPKTNKTKYMPTVSTPHQLEEKWFRLRDALIVKKNEELSTKPKMI